MSLPDRELPKHGEHWIHYKNPEKVYKILGISVECDCDNIDQMLIDAWCVDPDDFDTPIALIDTIDGYVLYDGTAILPDYVICRSYPESSNEKHSTWCRHKNEFMKTMNDDDANNWYRFTMVNSDADSHQINNK